MSEKSAKVSRRDHIARLEAENRSLRARLRLLLDLNIRAMSGDLTAMDEISEIVDQIKEAEAKRAKLEELRQAIDPPIIVP